MRTLLALVAVLVANAAVAAQPCPTDAQARQSLYVQELGRLKADDTFMVIQSGEQYVQFAGGKELLLDMPNQMLTGDREPKLRMLLGSNVYKNTFSGGYSLQATFQAPEQAAKVAEDVFRKVYGLPADYPVTGIATETATRSFDCSTTQAGAGVSPEKAEKAMREVLGDEFTIGQTGKDRQAPAGHTRPESATASVESARGFVTLWYDPAVWSKDTSLEKGEAEFVLSHKSGDAAAKLIVERVGLTLRAIKRSVMDNIKKVSTQSELVSEQRRTVNGVEVMVLHFTATVNDVPAAYLGYYWTGKAGTAQAIAYTTANLYDQLKPDFKALLDGLTITP